MHINTDVLDVLKLSRQELMWFKDECPSKVFDIEDVGGVVGVGVGAAVGLATDANDVKEAKLVISHPERCTACQCCVRSSKILLNKRKLKATKPIVTYRMPGQLDEPTTFRFALESVGGMKPKIILMKALDTLVGKCHRVATEIRRAKMEFVAHQP